MSLSDIHKSEFQKINPPTQLFINNQWINSEHNDTFDVIDPCNEEVICSISHAKKIDVDKSVKAARNAFEKWSKYDPYQRSMLLFKLADLIERDKEILGKLESLTTGKPLSASIHYDITQAATIFRYYGGWCDKLPIGDVIPSDPDHDVIVTREAIGVVGCIVPWNFPFMLSAWKLAPALCVGCTVVIKPAEQTPLTAQWFGKLVLEAGFPEGVINIVNGFGSTTGESMTTHPDIDKISFTGSTETGKKVMLASAQSNLKKISLELGGKSSNVVFDDADFDQAVDGACQALFLNMGENCCAGSRLFVQDTIYDKFVDELIKRVSKIHVGDPFDSQTIKASEEGKLINGPLIDKNQFNKVLNYIEIGKKEGATLALGGKRIGDKGYYIEPTIFTNVENNMRIAREEIFGPVLVVLRFKTFEEVIEKVNDNDYGLAAAIWSNDAKKLKQFTSRVKAGLVWTNTYNIVKYNAPFGGVKSTGFGRDLGKEALFEYLTVKTLVHKL